MCWIILIGEIRFCNIRSLTFAACTVLGYESALTIITSLKKVNHPSDPLPNVLTDQIMHLSLTTMEGLSIVWKRLTIYAYNYGCSMQSVSGDRQNCVIIK